VSPGTAITTEAGPVAAPAKLAALPPPSVAAASGTAVTFAEGGIELSPEARLSLDQLADRFKLGEERMRLKAYAGASGAGANSLARRLALHRALAVRSYLVGKGIEASRMDVQALGQPAEDAAPDRVEISLYGR
jgi:outer membrane protein OmpA-like peptidoglycan-associated protein